MPAIGKEVERFVSLEKPPASVDAMGYVEKIETKTEGSPLSSQGRQDSSQLQKQASDMGKIVSAQFSVQQKPSIMLPLDQSQVVEGLHHRVWEGIRWLSEWCIMMIKKYPGRVFYLPPR